MKYRHILSAAVLAFACGASTANALDLTGTWIGSEKCKGFNGAALKSATKDITVQITQAGMDLNFSIPNMPFNTMNGLYDGVALDNLTDANKGEVGLVRCGTSMTHSYNARLKAKADSSDGSGKLTGQFLWVNDDGVEPRVITCKYSLKRSSTANPMVVACP